MTSKVPVPDDGGGGLHCCPGCRSPGAGAGGAISISQPVSPAVSGLTCAPATVTAPGSATCTVTLGGPSVGRRVLASALSEPECRRNSAVS